MIEKSHVGVFARTLQPVMLLALVFGGLGSGLSARADDRCPTKADLSKGVLLTRSEPFFSVLMRQQGGELTERRVVDRGGVVEQVSTTYAHPLAAKLRREKSKDTELRYGGDTSILDEIEQKKVVEIPVQFWSGGTLVDEGVAQWRFVRRDKIDIGHCRYKTLVVHESLSLAKSGNSLSEQAFAPSLGLAVANIRLDVSGRPVSGVFFNIAETLRN